MFAIVVLGGQAASRGSGRYIWDVRFAGNIRGFLSAHVGVRCAMMLMMIFRPQGLWPSQRVLR